MGGHFTLAVREGLSEEVTYARAVQEQGAGLRIWEEGLYVLQDGEKRGCLGFWFASFGSVSWLLLPCMVWPLRWERDVCGGCICDGHAVKSSANIYWHLLSFSLFSRPWGSERSLLHLYPFLCFTSFDHFFATPGGE